MTPTDLKTIMVQGTASHVGKSLLTAAFLRIMKNRGLRVSPFKSQNMALNSFVTMDGGEIGRAQALQAEASGLEPTVDMNPILLKPTGDATSQVIVHGKVHSQMTAVEYHKFKRDAFKFVLESIDRLAKDYEVLVIEGAGSPAEINLREGDIVNMGLAERIDAPVILVADIDRGGVFASIVGTMELLSETERARVKGIIINKFRGDKTLLDNGLKFLEERLGKPVLGVVPHMGDTGLPDEDGVSLEKTPLEKMAKESTESPRINIAVIRLPRISNFTDFDPLKEESDVVVRYIHGPDDIPAMMEADLVILPGTKNIISDLSWLREVGIPGAIKVYLSKGGRLFGVCGGFQMLGNAISDPDGVEGATGSAEGLSLLDMETVLKKDKDTFRVEATHLGTGGISIEGYEIHMGRTTTREQAFATITARNDSAVMIDDGAVSSDKKISGTYIHGIFDNDLWRTTFLNLLREDRGLA
jgi:adenosylcobyric acid synthase